MTAEPTLPAQEAGVSRDADTPRAGEVLIHGERAARSSSGAMAGHASPEGPLGQELGGLQHGRLDLAPRGYLAADRLAALVAHELNTPLQAITNVLFLAEHDSGPQHQYIDQVRAQVDRLCRFIGQLREFAQPDMLLPAPLSGNQLLERVLSLQSAAFAARGISVAQDLANGLPLLRGAPGPLAQALFDLVEVLLDGVCQGTLLVRSRAATTPQGVAVELLLQRSRPDCGEPDPAAGPALDHPARVGAARAIVEQSGGRLELAVIAPGVSVARVLLLAAE
jgi:hypothetical protein